MTNVAPSVTSTPSPPSTKRGRRPSPEPSRDPGWEETLTATIDFDDGTGRTRSPALWRTSRPNATFTFSVNKQYGDNGTFTVTVTGYDDDTSGTGSAGAIVSNLAPTAAIDGSGKQVYDGKLRVRRRSRASPSECLLRGTDVGSDDLLFEWNWGDATVNTQTSRVNPPNPDPAKSPSVQPRDVTLSADARVRKCLPLQPRHQGHR